MGGTKSFQTAHGFEIIERTLMFIFLRLAELRLELVANLVEELIEPAGSAIGRGGAPHSAMLIQGHRVLSNRPGEQARLRSYG